MAAVMVESSPPLASTTAFIKSLEIDNGLRQDRACR
jgi:hypothetical protein